MEKRKRRCDFTAPKKTDESGKILPHHERKRQRIRGWFHEWGVTFHEYQQNQPPYDFIFSNVSAGICEDDDGEVYLVHPENITFV